MTAALAAPLARALAQIGIVEDDHDEQYRLATHDTARVLRILRSNPEVLAALAEALQDIHKCPYWQPDRAAPRLLDVLLGPKL